MAWLKDCECEECLAAKERGEPMEDDDYEDYDEAEYYEEGDVVKSKDVKDIKLSDIRLQKPSAPSLAKAIKAMRTYRDDARKAQNVSQMVLVGSKHELPRLDEICHANLARDLPIPPFEGTRVKYNSSTGNYDYWNFEKNVWQVAYYAQKRPKVPKKPIKYPFRYLVQFTNHHLKPEYHSENEPFKGEDLKACRAYYDWLRNRSHFSRFFAGSRNINTLTQFGTILDLSAPSFVVHFLAVAWRMPGEYVELVQQWYDLVHNKGIEPHIAFGVVQNVVGFNEPDGTISSFSSNGHNLIHQLSFDGIARMATGTVMVNATGDWDLRPARETYSTNSNWHFTDGNEKGWLRKYEAAAPVPGSVVEVEVKGYWGKMEKQKQVSAKPFQHVYDPGWLWLLGELGDYIQKKGW